MQELLQNTVKSARQALAFQMRCATTQINLGKWGEKVKRTWSSPKSSPLYLALCCAKAEKESHSNAKFVQESVHDEKEKSPSPSTASDKIGPVNKKPNCTFLTSWSVSTRYKNQIDTSGKLQITYWIKWQLPTSFSVLGCLELYYDALYLDSFYKFFTNFQRIRLELRLLTNSAS